MNLFFLISIPATFFFLYLEINNLSGERKKVIRVDAPRDDIEKGAHEVLVKIESLSVKDMIQLANGSLVDIEDNIQEGPVVVKIPIQKRRSVA